MLQKQSPGESPYQHQRSAYRAPPSNGRPQQVHISGRPMSRAVNVLRLSGDADCSCQAVVVKRCGHRPMSSCLRYPTFLSEIWLYPLTCQTLCAVHNGPPGWCHGSATQYRSPCATLAVYSISNPRSPQLLPLMTIPHTLELDIAPG